MVLALAESFWPRKIRVFTRRDRWLANLSISMINAFLLALLTPIALIILAYFSNSNGVGLLALLPDTVPLFVEVLIGFIILDLLIYTQHVLSHKVPFLWGFHKVHHADRDIDVTTGVRFHPVEAFFSMIYKGFFILILGPVPLAVFLFEIILNASALFNHANLKLPPLVDRVLRLLVVTPDTHRVHHSSIEKETNSNFGFCLLIWDRLFKTYAAQPIVGHDKMVIGLNEYQTRSPNLFVWILNAPFSQKNH